MKEINLDECEQEIIALMKELCPDFAPYNFLKKYDLYKGSLFGGTNMYYKIGVDNTRGMVTTKRNKSLYGLERFPVNFQTECDRNGNAEYGWSGDTLLELLKHIKRTGRIE